ncbi:MAG: tetratricopeptide repeat protein, partial [Parafilimonas sp.]|nr:tetratricopeptide repeat protein [Parafilimonas sp.]
MQGSKERLLGNLDKALDAFFKSAKLAEQLHNLTNAGDSYSSIADIYSVAGNHANATQYYHKAVAILRQSNDSIHLASALLNFADEFLKIKQYDSALLYLKESKLIFDKADYLSGKGYVLGEIGMVYAGMGNSTLAEKNINDAVKILEEAQDYYPICDYLISMSDIYHEKNDLPKAVEYASKSLQLAQQYKLVEQIRNASLTLSRLYEKSGDVNGAFTYYKNYIIYRDSLNNITSVEKMADLRTTFEVSQKQAEVNLLNQQKSNQRNILVSLAVILCLAIIIIFISLKHNRNKQKAYTILNEQKQETEKQKAKAEKALSELQVTQKQLIQSEKMASLGQLTA